MLRHIVLMMLITSVLVASASGSIVDRLAGEAVGEAVRKAQEEVAEKIVSELEKVVEADSVRIIILHTSMDWDGEFTRMLTENAVRKKRLRLVDQQFLTDKDQMQILYGQRPPEADSSNSIIDLRQYDLVLKTKVTERKLVAGKRKVVFSAYSEIIEPGSYRIIFAKRYRVEMEVEGKYSWEQMNEWFHEKINN